MVAGELFLEVLALPSIPKLKSPGELFPLSSSKLATPGAPNESSLELAPYAKESTEAERCVAIGTSAAGLGKRSAMDFLGRVGSILPGFLSLAGVLIRLNLDWLLAPDMESWFPTCSIRILKNSWFVEFPAAFRTRVTSGKRSCPSILKDNVSLFHTQIQDPMNLPRCCRLKFKLQLCQIMTFVFPMVLLPCHIPDIFFSRASRSMSPNSF
mmetsp:Transcript_12024/g.16622  ORF Transcript_12024/g.16622 Transcript_12024/m.16622 type:complete len:211 (+) Transcript_12024:332-964(+)